MECLSHIVNPLVDQLTSSFSAAVTPTNSLTAAAEPYDILCLGSGWTYSFLAPASAGLKITFTSRSPKQGGFVFDFDPDSDSVESFKGLPDAKNVIIIFPLYTVQAVRRLVAGYLKTRHCLCEEKGEGSKLTPRFILLGSTGIWDHGPTLQFSPLSDPYSMMMTKTRFDEKKELEEKTKTKRPRPRPNTVWKDRHSEVQPVPRALAENELLALNKIDNAIKKEAIPTSVLCLSGLWGHGRSPRRYLAAAVPTKEKLASLGSVHFIHGHDVARAILAMVHQWDKTEAQRWILTNERVYDLWDLCSRWGNAGEAGRDHPPQGPSPIWVQELIAESRQHKKDADDAQSSSPTSSPIRSIPRTVEQMGSALDGTEFWTTFEIAPDVPWVD